MSSESPTTFTLPAQVFEPPADPGRQRAGREDGEPSWGEPPADNSAAANGHADGDKPGKPKASSQLDYCSLCDRHLVQCWCCCAPWHGKGADPNRHALESVVDCGAGDDTGPPFASPEET